MLQFVQSPTHLSHIILSQPFRIKWEVYFSKDLCPVFVAASHQTRLDTRSKARRPIKVGIKGRGRSGTSRDSNPACLCCSSAHLVQCEPDEASSFTNPNVGPGTYASLRLKLDAWSSAVQRGQKCSSPTRRLPSRSWGPIRPRVCSWFRAPIRHECQTARHYCWFCFRMYMCIVVYGCDYPMKIMENEEVILHSPEIQNCNLNTEYTLILQIWYA